VLGPYREGQVSALNRVLKRAVKFVNNINESGWGTLAQRRMIDRICANCKLHIGRWSWKAIWHSLVKPCYLSREDYNRKVKNRKQRTYVDKYLLVIRTIKSWDQLPANLLVSFTCQLNTFRKRDKNVVKSKGLQTATECK
jgi:hypothetical protein